MSLCIQVFISVAVEIPIDVVSHSVILLFGRTVRTNNPRVIWLSLASKKSRCLEIISLLSDYRITGNWGPGFKEENVPAHFQLNRETNPCQWFNDKALKPKYHLRPSRPSRKLQIMY